MNWKTFLKTRGLRLLALVLVLVLIVGAVVGALSGRAGFLTNLDGILREPFQQASVTFAGWLEGIYGSIYRYDALKEENQRLQEELAQARAEARAGQEAVQENERLRDLLDLSQRHSDFKRTLLAMRQFLGQPLTTVPKPHQRKQRVGLFNEAGKLGPWTPDIIARHKGLQPHAHILPRRQQREHVGDLERLCDPHMREFVLRYVRHIAALEFDLAARRRERARQQVEIGAFASAVRTNDGCDRIARKFSGDVVQGHELTERLAHAGGAQDDLR